MLRQWMVQSQFKSQKGKKLIDGIVKILLENRGLKTLKDQKDFLNPKNPQKISAKDLDIAPKDLDIAVARIKKAIENKEKIIIYGDYDTDGVCATAILWETLYSLGADVLPFIPKRDEGYGLKVERIEEFAKSGVKIIITVDQGIVAYDQAEAAIKESVDLIITDHHAIGKKLPKACAIIHTLKLSGAGVSWFLAKQFGLTDLDLVTIGTIADLMPLTGANRSLVIYGLKSLQNTKRIGLQKLFSKAGIKQENISTYEIGYLIAPRINAAGRIEDPMDALRLLCVKNEEKAEMFAQLLEEKNKERQLLMEQMTVHARELWLKEDSKGKLIFISDTSYEEGIIGLIAGKLTEEFYRPSIILSTGEKYSKASARSIYGFNMVEAINSCIDLLESCGGHEMAAGFSVENTKLIDLKKRLTELAEIKIDEEMLKPRLRIDLQLELSDLTLDLANTIKKLAPFGLGNPEPVFMTTNLTVVEARTVGSDNKHLKLKIADNDKKIVMDGIAFGFGSQIGSLVSQKDISLVYNLDINEWNNEKKLQLKVKDFRTL
jgi:single-stranded-DNA-specific exonuclease